MPHICSRDFRHRHRDALMQIANELAARGLCHPLIPTAYADAKQYMRAFLHRRAQASDGGAARGRGACAAARRGARSVPHTDRAAHEFDISLVALLAQVVVHRSFTAREVLDLRALDASLRRALDHADVRSTKQLGKLLRCAKASA